MQRIKVKIPKTHRLGDAYEQAYIEVEARCYHCTYWDNKSRESIGNYGDCCRYPDKLWRHRDEWCGEFKPEEE